MVSINMDQSTVKNYRKNKMIVNIKGGKKDSRGKTQMSLLFDAPNALEIVTKVMEFGANKYERGNWKSLTTDELMSAMLRHMIEILKGNEWDDGPEGTGQLHWANVCCNAIFILEIELNKARKERPQLCNGDDKR